MPSTSTQKWDVHSVCRECWDPFFAFSLCFLLSCAILQDGEMPMYKDPEEDGRRGRTWTRGFFDHGAFITSWNVVEVTGWPGQLKVWPVGSKVMMYCILVHPKNNWEYNWCLFFLLSVILGGGESIAESMSFLLLFAFYSRFYNLFFFFLAWLFCTGNKHVEHILDMICLGQNWAFLLLHRGLWFSGYLVYLHMLPFCILRRVSKHLCGNAYPT